MHTWKKVISLLGVSTCAALLGAACTGEVTDRADTGDPVESAEEPLAAEGTAQPVIERFGERERCEEECHHRLDRCLHERRPDFVCRREHEECRERCRRD